MWLAISRLRVNENTMNTSFSDMAGGGRYEGWTTLDNFDLGAHVATCFGLLFHHGPL